MSNREDRYKYAIEVRDKDGYWLYSTLPEYSTEVRGTDILHVVKDSDRLDLLSHQYLGDSRLWWVIAEFNNIFWMFDLVPGTTLRIPSFERLNMEVLV